MKTKVKFPVFFEQDGPQFLTFMKFLEKNGVKWRSGKLPTDCKEIKKNIYFPAYILYWDKNNKEEEEIYRRDFKYITYLNDEDDAEAWFDENYYFNGEAEFENDLDD